MLLCPPGRRTSLGRLTLHCIPLHRQQPLERSRAQGEALACARTCPNYLNLALVVPRSRHVAVVLLWLLSH